MKTIVISLLLLNFTIPLFSQSIKKEIVVKPVIDTSVFGRWPTAGLPTISNDGNYALYMIRNQPAEGATLVIRSVKGEWEKQIINASNASFTADSRKAIFVNRNDSVCILILGNGEMQFFPNVRSFKIIKCEGEEWLTFQPKNNEKKLVILNLRDGSNQSFDSVINYVFCPRGKVLLLQRKSGNDSSNHKQTISWIDFPSRNAKNIWVGNKSSNFVFDTPGGQLAFVVEEIDTASVNSRPRKSIFYYRVGSEKAELLANDHTKGIESTLNIDGIADGFINDGKQLVINLRSPNRPKPQPDAVMVDVWGYQDAKLQSMQLAEVSEFHTYKALISIENNEIVRLQHKGDIRVSVLGELKNAVLITHNDGDLSEIDWSTASQPSYYLALPDSIQRGKLEIGPMPPFPISPTGRFLIGRGLKDRNNFFCYDIKKGKTINITHSIAAPFDKKLDDKPPFANAKWIEQANWIKNDEGLIITDRYDLWLADPNGIKTPVNLTNAYGQKNHIIFRLPEVYRYKSIACNSKIFLIGFNRISKEEGLYIIELGKQGDPKLLIKGSCRYEIPNNQFNSAQLDSSNTQLFLVLRESATQSPNYSLTSNFKTFVPITDVYPESSYNWLTSELHTWNSLNGESLQGILYKPQNFNPEKRYPVIFHYYQRMSDGLNKYLEPAAITDHLNIPWFVSNGYLVFTPDIHYNLGRPGEGSLNSLVSAAHYLRKFPWVDATRIGLQGQSFGGYETNYIVTHSTLFAAAMSSAGPSDLISGYGSISHGHRSAQNMYESGQFRIGPTLWERPDLYIENSPVFNAHKVTTPVLLMNNKDDGGVLFAQGVEFFTALRRLGKRVWMLQYDGEDHTISIYHKTIALQHTIRVTQFFNHYLKGAPAPRWMTRGIPALAKGIDNGLDFDMQIKTPGGGLLTPEEKKKVQVLGNKPYYKH